MSDPRVDVEARKIGVTFKAEMNRLKDIAIRAAGIQFNFWVGQIGYSVVTAAMFLRSYVVQTLTRRN